MVDERLKGKAAAKKQQQQSGCRFHNGCRIAIFVRSKNTTFGYCAQEFYIPVTKSPLLRIHEIFQPISGHMCIFWADDFSEFLLHQKPGVYRGCGRI